MSGVERELRRDMAGSVSALNEKRAQVAQLRNMLAAWQAYADTLAQAGVIAKPEKLMTQTANLLVLTGL